MKNKDPLGKPFAGLYQSGHVDVLWISLHPNFDKKTREYNIAILGLSYPLQFHAHLYQICLPSLDNTDANAGMCKILSTQPRCHLPNGFWTRDWPIGKTAKQKHRALLCDESFFRPRWWPKIFHQNVVQRRKTNP